MIERRLTRSNSETIQIDQLKVSLMALIGSRLPRMKTLRLLGNGYSGPLVAIAKNPPSLSQRPCLTFSRLSTSCLDGGVPTSISASRYSCALRTHAFSSWSYTRSIRKSTTTPYGVLQKT